MATTTVRGCDLAYELSPDRASTSTGGCRATFVWAHGLTSSRADEDIRPLVDVRQLADHQQVLRFDARGHGLSGPMTDSASGDWAQLALDEIALIDALELEDVVLGGASMGAATTLHAALRLGSRAKKLVLVIPPTAWEARRAQVELYEQMEAILDAQGVEPLIRGMNEMPPPDPFRGTDEWALQRSDALRRSDPARLAAVFRGAATADLPDADDIRTIDLPTLVLAWSGDPGHPVATADRLGTLLPNSEVVIARTADELATWTGRVAAFIET